MTDIESTVAETGPVARTLEVKVSADKCRSAFEAAYKSLAKQTSIKGFRKGHVPRRILEERYAAEVEQEVVGDLIQEGCVTAVREHELEVVAAPKLLSHSFDAATGLRFEARVETRPQFEVPEYKTLECVRNIVRVTDEDIDAALEGLRDRMAELVTETERSAVETNDIVVFDMYGFDGEEPVPGTSGEGVQLEVGAGRFPEDFETQMVGVERDTKSAITVEFPEDHGDERLRGRTVRFDVTVTEIKRKVVPELNDEFVAELGIEDCDDLAALRTKVRDDLEGRAKEEGNKAMTDELITRVVDAVEFELPESLVEETLHDYLHDMGGHDLEEDKEKELREALLPRARGQVKARFVLDAVAEAEGVEVSEEELTQRIRSMVASAGENAERVREHYRRPSAVLDLQKGIAREKAVARIAELSTVTDAEIDKPEVAAPGQSG